MNGTEQLPERVAQHARGFGPEGGTPVPGRLPAPADRAVVRRAEGVLGFALPPLLAETGLWPQLRARL
ncbi:hypothetical protein [Streptomyces sp. NPDC001194]|uniref:hypothetical protein n=1 Tax=Streptomyces sp. NPDC001194 TaxID=3364547 RepID=UPI0036A861C4